MKCAMEMKFAVEEKLIQEEIERKIKEQKQFEENMNKYLTQMMPKLNNFIEQQLLKGNGKMEFFVKECTAQSEKGFCYIGEIKNPYNTELPYWNLIYHSSFLSTCNILYLEHYIKFLKELCYDITIEDATFRGCSSTGKSKEWVSCQMITIKIPENPCQ